MDTGRNQLLLALFIFLLLETAIVTAAGEGSYGNETYGNFSYGISSLAVYSFNVFITIPANNLTTINATASTNVTLEIMTNTNASGFITIAQYNSLPPGIGSIPASSLNKFADIVPVSSISNALNYSTISLKYSDAEVSAANLQESTMRLYRWNGSSWNIFDSAGNGINTSGNYAFANTSAFSVWGIFGTAVPVPQQQQQSSSSSSSGSSGSGGGGGNSGGVFFVCNMDWKCSEWSDCINDLQTRQCEFVKVPQHARDTQCPEQSKSPITSQTCQVKAEETSKTTSTASAEIKEKTSTSKTAEAPTKKLIEGTSSAKKPGLIAITGNAINRVLANPKAVTELKITSLIASIMAVIGIFSYRKFFKSKT